MRYITSLLFILFCLNQGITQLNLNVIYSIARTQPEVHNTITEQFNKDRIWLNKSYDNLKWLNGFGLGLRYRVDRVAFDIRWENQIDRINVSGTDPNDSSAFSQELFFKMTTYGVGIEGFLSDNISLRSSLDFNKLRYRVEQTNIDDKFEVMKNWSLGSTFSIGYNFVGGGLVHVSLRPFIHVSWTDHALDELNTFLNPGVQETASLDKNEGFSNYGLRIIFYNGQW